MILKRRSSLTLAGIICFKILLETFSLDDFRNILWRNKQVSSLTDGLLLVK